VSASVTNDETAADNGQSKELLMTTRYLLVLSESEGIHCVGMLPRVGERLTVRKKYGANETLLCRVVDVRHAIDVSNLPFDAQGARDYTNHGDLPEVLVSTVCKEEEIP
jgi:hypothetical protein